MGKYMTVVNPDWVHSETYDDGTTLHVFYDRDADMPDVFRQDILRDDYGFQGLHIIQLRRDSFDLDSVPYEISEAVDRWGWDSKEFERYMNIFYPKWGYYKYTGYGYCQGDIVELMFVFDDTFEWSNVRDAEDFSESLGEEYRCWVFGDTYYFEQEGQLCGGFFGQDFPDVLDVIRCMAGTTDLTIINSESIY